MSLKSTLSALAVASAMLMGASSANAVIFDIAYDDTPTGAIDGTIAGTGVLSYDGAPAAGFFALDTLTGLSFSASFTSGESWTLADLVTPLADASIFVTDQGGGNFSFVFASDGFLLPFGGSADFMNLSSEILSHEPTDLSGIGCCGGTSIVNLYFTDPGIGLSDYAGVSVPSTTTVPEPGTLALFGLGLAGLGFARRRKAAA